jgi:hypothetical protein
VWQREFNATKMPRMRWPGGIEQGGKAHLDGVSSSALCRKFKEQPLAQLHCLGISGGRQFSIQLDSRGLVARVNCVR